MHHQKPGTSGGKTMGDFGWVKTGIKKYEEKNHGEESAFD